MLILALHLFAFVIDYKKIFSSSIFVISLISLSHAYGYTRDLYRHSILVDTGYDLCNSTGKKGCENNRNLLFRGMLLPSPYDPEPFLLNVLYYLLLFKRVYASQALLPNSMEELKNYRIVVINLSYGHGSKHIRKETQALREEYKLADPAATNVYPQEHVMYNLDSLFNPNSFAFEWWPVTLKKISREHNKPDFESILNWSDKKSSVETKSLNLPYLITGKSFFPTIEEKSKSIYELLNNIPQDGHPLLIFYHCVSGIDRTGAVTMSYFIVYGGYPYVAHNNTKTSQLRFGPMNYAQALAAMHIQPNHRAQRLSRVFCLLIKKDANQCAMQFTNALKDEVHRFSRRMYKKIFLTKPHKKRLPYGL